MTAKTPGSPASRRSAHAPLLAVMEELAGAPTNGSPWEACANPDAFARALAGLRSLGDPRAHKANPSRGPLSAELRSSATDLASATRSHALRCVAQLGSPALWSALAGAMESSPNSAAEAQELFELLLPSIASDRREALALSLCKAGALCHTHEPIHELCQKGGAALLDHPALRSFFAQGIARELRQAIEDKSPRNEFGLQSRARVRQITPSIIALPSPAFAKSLADLLIKTIEDPALRLWSLGSIWAKCGAIADSASAQNSASIVAPSGLSAAHREGASRVAPLWREALKKECETLARFPRGSEERLDLLYFLSSFSVEAPSRYLRLARDLAPLDFEASEIKPHGARLGIFNLDRLQGYAQKAPPAPLGPLPLPSDRLGLFDIAFLSAAPQSMLAALARVSPPDVSLIHRFVNAHPKCPPELNSEQTALWLESVSAKPAARAGKTLSL